MAVPNYKIGDDLHLTAREMEIVATSHQFATGVDKGQIQVSILLGIPMPTSHSG